VESGEVMDCVWSGGVSGGVGVRGGGENGDGGKGDGEGGAYAIVLRA